MQESIGRRLSLLRPNHSGAINQAVVVFLSLLASSTHSQNSLFLSDAPGNLLVQTSEKAALPQILGQPQNQIVIPGASASFTVVVADTRGLSYQWFFNGGSILGATGDALLLTNVSTTDEGSYSVVLVNGSGSTTSALATLFIDVNANGIPDSWEFAYFHKLVSATGDEDGDGVSNLQEYLDGTNPTNALSALYRIGLGMDGGAVVIVPDQPAYTNGQTVTLTAVATNGVQFHAWIGDVNTHSNTISVVMNTNRFLSAYFSPFTFQWTNTANGDWNVASNWNPNLPPGPNDSAILSVGAIVTLNQDLDLANLTFGAPGNSPTLTATGTLTIHGTCSWTLGTMSGSGRTVIAPGATLNLISSQPVGLVGRTLENQGTVFWSGTGSLGATDAVITNAPAASFLIQNPVSLFYSGGAPGRFDNAGTLMTSSSGGNTSFSIGFDNYGTAQIPSGMLSLFAGGTNAGSLSMPAGTTLDFAGGTFVAGASSVIAGAGTLLVNGANATLAGVVNLTGPHYFSNGVANFTGNYTCANNMVIAGATASFNGTGTVAPPTLTLSSSGTLDGSQTVTVGNTLNWTGGAMNGTGRTVIPAGATLNINNPSAVFITSRTLENGGTAIWTGPGSIGMNGGVITNWAGALFNAQTAAQIFQNGGFPSRLDNAGTFRTTAPGTTSVSASMNNYSLVDIQAGTLSLFGGGTNVGTISVPAGASINFAGGTFGDNSGASISGGGSLMVNGGQLTLAGTVNLAGPHYFSNGLANLTGNYTCTNAMTIAFGTASFNGTGIVAPPTLDLSIGTLDGTQTVTVGKTLNWISGAMSGTGRTVIAPGGTLNLGGPATMFLASRTLENAGTAIWTGSGGIFVNGAVFTNRPGALFNAQSAASLSAAGGAPRFDNAGIFRKSVSTGATTFAFPFTNYGLVDLQSGFLTMNGGYASASNAVLNCVLAGNIPGTNFGQLQAFGAVTLNGALSVNFANGYLPTTNDSFTVLTAGARNGTFGSFSYPATLVTMQLSNTPNSVVVLVSRLGPADKVLVPPEISGSNITLCWGTLPNVTYRLEVNSTLDPATWTPLPGDITSSGNIACKTDVVTASNRFYRVRVLP
jgi:hypothetical protein